MPRALIPSESGASPTASQYLPSSTNPVPNASSVRRNLFSAHLSRRPASGSQPSSQGASHTHPHPQLEPHHPETQSQPTQNGTGQGHYQVPQTTTAAAAPTVSQVHAASRHYQHQRSVSSPSLSPSPPRLSPFHNLPPTATFSHNAANPPPFAPTPPRHLVDTYDPTISPNRPLSPRSRDTLYPNSSAIAINPVTGRPVLPHLPVLPGRLRLSDDDLEGGGDEEDDDETHNPEHQAYHNDNDNDTQQQHFYAQARNQGGHSYLNPSSADADHNQIHGTAMLRTSEEASLEADEERRDRERIERLLREMMARQRARAKGKASSVGPGSTDGFSHSHGTPSNAGSRSRRSRRRDIGTRGAHTRDDDVYASASGDGDTNGISSDSESEAEAKAEEEELMGLITASLRREVARADDDGWMFGDGGGLGLGREDGLVGAGGYD